MAVNLYIHIPYCYSKCDYCDFFSIPCNAVPDEYIDALIGEWINTKNCDELVDFSTIYIGGGNPGLLSVAQLKRLVNNIITKNDCAPKEFTIEMNPESVTKEWLENVIDCDVTRVSLGVQSLNDAALKAVKRSTTVGKTIKALSLINKYWVGGDNCTSGTIKHGADGDVVKGSKRDRAFNVDIIVGLPRDNKESLIATIDEVIKYNPNHISLYQLTIEEGTPLAKAINSSDVAIDQGENNNLWLTARKHLKNLGYIQYEVSNFYKKGIGAPSLHNMNYWHQGSYIGLGAGATSTVYWGVTSDSGDCAIRWTNTKDIGQYIKNNTYGGINKRFSSGANGGSYYGLKGAGTTKRKEDGGTTDKDNETEYLNIWTLLFEHFMLGLRTVEGVDIEGFSKRFGFTMPKCIRTLFENWEKRGLALISDTHCKLSDKGLLILDTLLIELLGILDKC